MAARKNKNKDKNMSIWKHLAELRRRFTIIAIALLAGSIVFYFLSPPIIQILLLPAAKYFDNPNGLPPEELVTQIYFFQFLTAFTLRFFVGFVTSLVVTSPIWLWQILAFLLPALHKKERRWFIPTFIAAVILFVGGTVFCYFLILDPAFQFLFGQAADIGQVFPEAASAVDTVLLFEVAFGVAFELPLVIFYLTVFQIVPYKKLRKSWRIIYLILLIVSAFVTPDASPVTMLLMFCAMALLYEGSLFISRIVLAKRIKEREARDAAEAAEEARLSAALSKRKSSDA